MTAHQKRHSKVRYGVKPGSRVPPEKAQTYGDSLQRLAERYGGRLDAEIVVEASRNPASPLHEWFEWDDSTAAEEYRKEQARALIRAIVICEKNPRVEVRAFHHVVLSEEAGGSPECYYVPTEDVLKNRGLLQQVLQEALDYLCWFRKKYAILKELGGVHREIDRLIAKKRTSISSRGITAARRGN